MRLQTATQQRATPTSTLDVITVIPSVSRRAGGPFLSARRLSQSVAATERARVRVFGVEDEFSQADAPAWSPLEVRAFRAARPRFLVRSPDLRRALLASSADIVHVHSLWLYTSIAALAWRKRQRGALVISPRGMLDPWALKNSAWKKEIALRAFERAHLEHADCLHALCESEAESIRSFGLKNPICVIPNGVDLPNTATDVDPPWTQAISGKRKVLLFLGRLHAKKGLAELLEAWRILERSVPESREWVLGIIGWDDGDGARLKATNQSDSVLWLGPAYGAVKQAALAAADAFVLPSHSEGLPMAVLEAWAHGLPTLITDGCNLPEAFSRRASIRITTNAVELVQTLANVITMPAADLRAYGERGLALARESFTWEQIGRQMGEVYRWLKQGGLVPACVRVD